MVEGLRPAAPSPGLLVDENSQRERDAEQDREECRCGISCNKKTSDARARVKKDHGEETRRGAGQGEKGARVNLIS